MASFVNPARVPPLADANEFWARLPRGAATYIGPALNLRGPARAIAAKLDAVNFVVVASGSFSQRNQGMTAVQGLTLWADVHAAARGQITAGLTIGAAFGCPFEGEISVSRLLQVVFHAMQKVPADPCRYR